MVAAVRAGESLRRVARRFQVSLDTVRRWVGYAGHERLDRVDWRDHTDGPEVAANRAPVELEDEVLAWRAWLRSQSELGEYGALAIQAAMRAVRDPTTAVARLGEPLPELAGVPCGAEVPCVRTIHRILDRRGALDGVHRPRSVPPPRGWYLPDVADGRAGLDYFDVVMGLVIANGPEVEVLNTVSLHGGLVEAWPTTSANAHFAREAMERHWRCWGLPCYAQFDNDSRFQGAHQYADVISSVMRLCLSLGVTVVFVPPREPGFQAAMESFNAQWEEKVWRRFRHADLEALCAQSARYVAAYRARRASRMETAPPRSVFPEDWQLDLQRHPQGRLVYIRRIGEDGRVSLLGRRFEVDVPAYRLVRCEVLLDAGRIQFYRLRRREPHAQPLIGEVDYQLPRRRFRGA